MHKGLVAVIVRDLMRDARAESPLRIWLPSCSSGEDAYSLAICLFEEFRKAGRQPHVRIFATDSDETMLTRARAGLCDASAASGLTDDLLRSYFHRISARGYQVTAALRGALVFGVHDISTDPPIFSRLDLISLRNLPAGLSAQRLNNLILRFHFALRNGGWLDFGPGPMYEIAAELFEPVSAEQALYQKRRSQGMMQRTEPNPDTAIAARKAQLEKELRAANSTIASMTDELEITNQRLHSSNAELRSINEELMVFNSELQLRVRNANETNADITALIASIDVAVVFLDTQLRIRRFSPGAANLLGLTLGNVGQTLSVGDSEFVDGGFAEEVKRVMAGSSANETEIPCAGGQWYLRRMRKIHESEGAPGAVITWIDITRTKTLQQDVLSVADLEQQRIGRELHDDIQQELTGLGLLAQNINESWTNADRDGARRLLARLVEGIVSANLRVRSLARGLVPIPVDAESLVPALARLVRSTQESSGIACEFEPLGAIRINGTETASHLYRIAQEALHNAVRHSRASKVRIRLDSRDDELLLEICDDGIGIVPRFQMHQGMGVRLMEHRCSLIGGRFAAEQQPTGGTRVSCRVPTGSRLSSE